jgi:hypothetical protein
MPKTRRAADNVAPVCPNCQSRVVFVASWSCRGVWGYREVRTYECPAHGPIFVSPEPSIGTAPDKNPHQAPDDSDRDSLIPAPRKPAPTLDVGAIALPEPDSN